MKSQILYAVVALFLVACASPPSTSLSNSWKSPASSASLQKMNRVLVVALSNNDAQRRTMEDAFVSNLSGKATASYSYFKIPLSQVNKEIVCNQLANDGYNGAIVIRLVNQQTTGSSRPPSVGLSPQLYWGFGSNLSAGVSLDFDLGANNQKTVYSIEASLYAFPNEDLLWSGTVVASNPKDINSLSHTISSAVFSKMKSDGLY